MFWLPLIFNLCQKVFNGVMAKLKLLTTIVLYMVQFILLIKSCYESHALGLCQLE